MSEQEAAAVAETPAAPKLEWFDNTVKKPRDQAKEPDAAFTKLMKSEGDIDGYSTPMNRKNGVNNGGHLFYDDGEQPYTGIVVAKGSFLYAVDDPLFWNGGGDGVITSRWGMTTQYEDGELKGIVHLNDKALYKKVANLGVRAAGHYYQQWAMMYRPEVLELVEGYDEALAMFRDMLKYDPGIRVHALIPMWLRYKGADPNTQSQSHHTDGFVIDGGHTVLYDGPAYLPQVTLNRAPLSGGNVWASRDGDFLCSTWCQREGWDRTDGTDQYTGRTLRHTLLTWLLGPGVTKFGTAAAKSRAGKKLYNVQKSFTLMGLDLFARAIAEVKEQIRGNADNRRVEESIMEPGDVYIDSVRPVNFQIRLPNTTWWVRSKTVETEAGKVELPLLHSAMGVAAPYYNYRTFFLADPEDAKSKVRIKLSDELLTEFSKLKSSAELVNVGSDDKDFRYINLKAKP